MKTRDYCCCAIPMLNAGIYATITEQFVVAAVVGALALTAPSIVGVSAPSYASVVLAGVCFAVAAIQLLGFLSVARERPRLYRWYATLHGLAITAAFSVAAVWIIMSAIRHETAKQKCIADFYAGEGGDGSQGDTLCTIFPWVDVGIMGGLWVILVIFHIYLLVVLSSWGKSQRQDHDDYDRLYNPSQPLTRNNIPLEERKDPWDSQDSSDENLKASDGRDSRPGHGRNISSLSASDVVNQPPVATNYDPGAVTYVSPYRTDNARAYGNNQQVPYFTGRRYSDDHR